ncbi:hypothetical protein NLJ89_g6137 [Agrocybe chaxingu]|uniref:Brl1/Brr6 domain-containing protein n=1 Tax=Agrocybe chaxingu TaxID=84603 RepID=A0A9W8K1A6_9AGAR|nr:hypothetical protein NLJ89_g6137 [Agrocybe chaxingu]
MPPPAPEMPICHPPTGPTTSAVIPIKESRRSQAVIGWNAVCNAFWALLGGVAVYFVVAFSIAFWKDLKAELSIQSSDLAYDAAMCAKEYDTNLCATLEVPELVSQCNIWERCMNANHLRVKRTEIVANLSARLIEMFVGNMSLRTWMNTHLTESPIELPTFTKMYILFQEDDRAHDVDLMGLGSHMQREELV